MRYYPIDLPQEEPQRLLGAVITDVTGVYLREEQLRQLAHITEQSPGPVAVPDLEGHTEYVNPAFERNSGYSRDELLGQTPALIRSGQTPDSVYRELWATITAGKVWTGEFLNRRKDGTLYWEFEVISPLKDDSGRITNYIALKQDITELKEAEQELSRIAFKDPLSGIYNRVGFTRKLQNLIDQHGWPSAGVLVTFNISGLQDINDAYGYEVGDQLLQAFGQRLEGVPGEQVLAGRIVGDEFTLFSLPGSALALEPYLTELIQSLTRPVDLANVITDRTS